MKHKLIFAAAILTCAILGVSQTPPTGNLGEKAATPPTGKQGVPATRPPKPPPPPKPAWQEFKLNPKTTMFLDFTESNPDMVISIFSRTSGITILKDPQFKTPLTVTSAKAVGLNEAFEIFNTVLGLNNYELRKQGNMLLVGRKQPPMVTGGPPPPPPPQPIVKTYPLKNANAAQVARVINDVFAQGAATPGPQPGGGGPIIFGPGGPQPMPGGGGAPGGPAGNKPKASSEDYSNSVVVIALPNDQKTVEELIKDLDKPTTTPLESEVFPLKYVPAEDVLPAIEDILTSNAPLGRGMNRQNNQGGSFFFFGGFGGNNRQRTAGGQTATAIKPTNSVIVNALKENLELIRKLLSNLDQPGQWVGTTFVVKLENAKAADVAELLNRAYAQRDNRNNDSPFFFFSDFGSNNQKESPPTDINERGEVVNVRDVVGKVTIIADPNTNSLVIVTQPSNMRMISEVIGRLDHVAEQVMIETVIVEANLDKTTKLGVEWTFGDKKLGNSDLSGAGNTNFGLQNAVPALEGLRYTITHQDYKAFLNLIKTDTKFKVLDTPKIFTSNNVKAEINVSQKLPYITSQQTGVGGNLLTTYNFQDVGVILTVTPRITQSGHVVLEVTQSADDLQGFTDFNAPIINSRKASTTVTVADGETIVLGGIIRHTQNVTEKKIPLLGDLPLVGHFFKSSSNSQGQTELMVFLTPRIVRTKSEAQQIKEEEIKKLSKESQDTLKKHVPPPGGGGG